MAVSWTSAADHAAHDELLLAALASGDALPADERATAAALVRDCPDCADLVADLRFLRFATAELTDPPRRRDYRLTDADAARLQPAGWRRLAAALASARLAFTAPLGAGLVAIGVVAGLVAIVPGAGSPIFTNVSGNLSAADSFDASGSAGAGAVAAPELAPVPSGGGDTAVSGLAAGSGEPVAGGPAAAQPASPPAAGTAGDQGPRPSDSAAKIPGNAAGVVPAPDASVSPGGAAVLVPAPDASAAASDAAAMALPDQPSPSANGAAVVLPEQPSPTANGAAIPRVQTPGALGSGARGAPAPASQPAATAPPAPTSPGGGGGTSGLTWLTIASLALVAVGITLLVLRFVAVRVTSR